MSNADKSLKNWRERLKDKYRLVIMEDETLELKSSVKLTLLNVYLASSVLVVLLSAIVFSLIYFTPLKNYIAGYDQIRVTKQALEQERAIDSLLRVTRQHDVWLENILARLKGEVDTIILERGVSFSALEDLNLDDVPPEDQRLREQVAREDYFNLREGENGAGEGGLREIDFITPLDGGVITSKFDPTDEHFGIDITDKEGRPVRAIQDGVVIDSYWDSETGNVLVVQHENELISLYKHNKTVLKKVGTFVRAGDAIAIIGNTGELSSGPHLHLEMWYERAPVDPEEYIIFQ